MSRSDPRVGDLATQQQSGGAASVKVSETFFQFAQPLLQADPEGLGDLETLRSVVQLAEMCWNLPVLETARAPGHAAMREGFAAVLGKLPSGLAEPLQRLLTDRETIFGDVPFLISVRVEGDSLADARLVAAARMPRSTVQS